MRERLEQFLSYLEGARRYSKHTVQAYRTDILQCILYMDSAFDVRHAQDVTHQLIRSWMVHLIDRGIGARSVNRKISALRAFFNYLKRMEVVTSNPTKKVISPKIPKRLPQYLQEKEVVELLDETAFSTDYTGKKERMILLLLYHTGLRRAELIELKHQNINLSNMTMKVMGKGGKERIIPFGPNLLEEIKAYIAAKEEYLESGEEFFCLSDSGNKLTPKTVYTIVRKHLMRVSTISMKSPHILRHSFATHLSNKGAELNAIKELLGHANLSATQVYTHNTIERLKEVYRLAHPKGGAEE